MAFKYRARSNAQWESRANQSGGEFESWLKDEYRSYTPIAHENCIRILPPSPAWEDAQHYGLEVWVHYGIGPDRASVLCLFRMRKEACPICEDRARAERAKDEDLARELRATKRVLVFLINRKDESQGPLAWGMPYTVDAAITKAAKDRSTGGFYFIDDHENGYDIYFDRDGEKMLTKYTGVSLARKSSSVATHITDWIETHPIPEALRWRTYEEVNRLYVGAGRGEAASETPTTARSSDRRGDQFDPRPEPSGRRQPLERPTRSEPSERAAPADLVSEEPFRPPSQSADTAPLNNGGRMGDDDHDDDDGPPFDTDKPADAPPPGRSRAEELRALAAQRLSK